jgi:hypothetical protein
VWTLERKPEPEAHNLVAQGGWLLLSSASEVEVEIPAGMEQLNGAPLHWRDHNVHEISEGKALQWLFPTHLPFFHSIQMYSTRCVLIGGSFCIAKGWGGVCSPLES